VDEIAFTRGATEALMTLIGGFNRLRPGDAVLYADLDYDSTQAAFRQLKERRGVDVVAIGLPEPATHQNLIDAYDAALTANPKVRLMLLTHVSHRTGLVLPVAQIVALARSRGVDVILDSAHAWGQLDFKLPDTGADFIGLTCQKWIGAPVGVGLFYVKKARQEALDDAWGIAGFAEGDIRRKIHTGTANMAGFLALDEALSFHQRIGAAAKEARLRHLRDRWAEALRGRIEILTPSDPRLTSGIAAFRLKGRTSVEDNRQLAETLLRRFNIFTVERTGIASGACIRVTAAIFTREADIDRLVAALTRLA
jgi:selenocysteine lyase/cysteine desulfurase